MNIIGFKRGLRVVVFSLAAVSCAAASQLATVDSTPVSAVALSMTEDPLLAAKKEVVAEMLFDRGIASWYGPGFHGRRTANGETYDQNELTAAHRTLPFNTLVRVENVINGKSVIVRINDRGPYVGNRIIDLSRKAAHNIEMVTLGTTEVQLTVINPDSLFERKELLQERFTLQLGSFSQSDHAHSVASDLSGSRVAEAKVEDRIYYRVYYGMYATRREAEDALSAILKKGHTGFVKQL